MTEATLSMKSPWSPLGARLTGIAVGIGIVLSFLGWLAASDRPTVEDQAGPVSLGIAGAALVLATQAAWLFGGRRAIVRRRRSLIGLAARVRDSAPTRARSTVLVAVEGLRLYHRSDCLLAPSDAVQVLDPASSGAWEACGVCGP